MAKKIKKKRWIRIVSSLEFGNRDLGETYTSEPEKMVGKNVLVNYSNLSGDPRRQNLQLRFKIMEFKGDQLNTEVYGCNIISAHVKRMMRKNKEKIDDSFICETKDKLKIRVKPFMITRNRTNNAVKTKLRMDARKLLINQFKNMNYKELYKPVVSGMMQKGLKSTLKKIYPLNIFEIRSLVRV